MKITITEFMTLDGVTQGSGSADEDTSNGFTAGGWLVPHMDETFIRQASEWLDLADGLLLGRRTYEAVARDRPQITAHSPNSRGGPQLSSAAMQWQRCQPCDRSLAANSRSTAATPSPGRSSKPVSSTRYAWSSPRQHSAPADGCSVATQPASDFD